MGILDEVTPESKDLFLHRILSTDYAGLYSDFETECARLNIGEKSLAIIINQFEEIGLIKKRYFMGGSFSLDINASAIDLYNRGGFVGQETILLQNLDKLILEIDKLKKDLKTDHLETLNRLTTIATNISAFIPLIKK